MLSSSSVKGGGVGRDKGSAHSCQSDNGSFSQPPVSFCMWGVKEAGVLLCGLQEEFGKWGGVQGYVCLNLHLN